MPLTMKPQNPIRRNPNLDPADAAATLAPNAAPTPQYVPSILDEDPGTFGSGRDDLYEKYVRAAAMKGLQLKNETAQQQIDLHDPEQQRLEGAKDIDFERGLLNNGGPQDINAATAGMDALRKFGLVRAEGEGKNAAASEEAFSPAHQLLGAEKDTAAAKAHEYKMAEISATAGAKPLDVQTEGVIRNLKNTYDLGNRILPLIDQLDQHASEYRNLGFLQKLPGVGYSNFQNYLYSKGMPVDNLSGELDQLTALMQASGIAGMSVGGRPSVAWIDLLKKHLMDGTQPTGEIKARVSEIMSLIPEFAQNAIGARHGDISEMMPGAAGGMGGGGEFDYLPGRGIVPRRR